MQFEFAPDTANAIVKYKSCIEAYHFLSLDLAMSGDNVQYSTCMMFILFVL